MKTESKPLIRHYVVKAIVHYTHGKGSHETQKTISLTLRSLFEVPAIPQQLENIERVLIGDDFVCISAIHIYDEVVDKKPKFSFYN